MPPKKLPPRVPQQKPQGQNAPKTGTRSTPATASDNAAVPDHEVKKSSSMSAQLALEAAKQAFELRQAAYGAGDPNAREEILAKAVNKEIEAESFGKAAKYTRSGAFQGLAAGAGLGVQPGVTIGKLSGALVGGLVSSVGAVLGGGVGSAYGAISGPFWDLGQMASQGVRSIVGDFPNWDATPSQKKAFEKMVMGAQQTKAPDQGELEQMRADNGGADQRELQQFTSELANWIPGMPSMPSMPSAPSMPSIPGLGGFLGGNNSAQAQSPTTTARKQSQGQQAKPAAKPRAPSTPQNAPPKTNAQNVKQQQPQSVSPKAPSEAVKQRPQTTPPKATTQTSKPQQSQNAPPKTNSQSTQPEQLPKADQTTAAKRKPKKLEPRSASTTPKPDQPPVRKAPPKLEPRRKPATTNA